MATVGSLVVKMSVRHAAFTRGMTAAGRSVNRFAGFARAGARMLVGFGATLLATVGPILSVYGAIRAMRIAESFQQEMNSSLAIVKGVTPQLRKEMENLTKSLAYEMKYSARELTKGYYYLFSAGLDVEKSMGALPITARFAQAAMADLAESTDILTDAMTSLGADRDPLKYLENMAGIADMVGMAATQANASITQFGQAITNKAGARMKMLNIPLSEGLSLLQAFAAQGKKSAEGGTAFDIVLRDITASITRNAAAFKAANIEVFTAAGQVRALSEVIQSFEQVLGRLSPQQKIHKMMELGIPTKSGAFLAMVLGMSEQMRDWAEANLMAGGTIQEIADKQLPPFTKAWNKVKAVFEGFTINLLAPWLSSLGESFGLLFAASNAADSLASSMGDVDKNSKAVVTSLEGMEKVIGWIADAAYFMGVHTQMVISRLAALGRVIPGIARAIAQLTRANWPSWPSIPLADYPSQRMLAEKVRRQNEAMKAAAAPKAFDIGGVGVGAPEIEGVGATADQMRKVARIFEETLTPVERLEAKIADLNKLVEVGALKSWDLYQRAIKNAVGEYQNAAQVMRGTPLARMGGAAEYELWSKWQNQQRGESADMAGMGAIQKHAWPHTQQQQVDLLAELKAGMDEQNRLGEMQTQSLRDIADDLHDIEELDL